MAGQIAESAPELVRYQESFAGLMELM